MITRDNYEIYVIDYLDGNLSVEDQKSLMDFLSRNIDLKEEFELMKDFQMPESNAVFEDKASLKKELKDQPIDDSNIDEWCIASIENDLSKDDQDKFESEIQGREEFQQIYALYQQTQLSADNITFPDFKPWRLPNFNAEPQLSDVDFWIIASLEGDLNPTQQNKWNTYKTQISNIKEIEDSYQNIKLKPEAISYPNKNELKHKKSRVRYLYPLGGIAAAAAAFYLFLNITNFQKDTFKNYNDQVAQMEQNHQEQRYLPESSLIPRVMLTQVTNAMETMMAKERNTEEHKKRTITPSVMAAPKYASTSSIEPIKKREVRIDVPIHKTIEAEQPAEVIIADNLMSEYAPENKSRSNSTERNKLTLFRVAQIGVNALNNKAGTEMKLEAQYNKKGEKKKVKFSNRFISVSKTINK
jgi:hypothetical protein